MGISESRVCQLQKRAVERLSREVQGFDKAA
jgi:DNA-directed RNA polymerase specialized sigma subunit